MKLVKKIQAMGFQNNDTMSLEFSYYKYLRTYRQVTYNDLDKENLIALLEDLLKLVRDVPKNIKNDLAKYLRSETKDIYEYDSLVNFLDNHVLFKCSNFFDPKDCDITIDYFTTMRLGSLVNSNEILEKMNILKLVRIYRNRDNLGLVLK
ncbi:MAG: hypothetical protein ACYC4T_03225 [Melioribacteraceae bacterium]